MAQVQMQVYRGTSDYLDTISNVDGQFLYDEDTHQILVDNGTTREQYGGGNEKVYDTYAEAVADLANIADGQTVFVKEGTSSDKPTITYAEWQQLSDIEKEAFSGYVSNFPEEQLNASAITYGNTNVGAELTSINTHLSTLNVDIDYTGISHQGAFGNAVLNNGVVTVIATASNAGDTINPNVAFGRIADARLRPSADVNALVICIGSNGGVYGANGKVKANGDLVHNAPSGVSSVKLVCQYKIN